MKLFSLHEKKRAQLLTTQLRVRRRIKDRFELHKPKWCGQSRGHVLKIGERLDMDVLLCKML